MISICPKDLGNLFWRQLYEKYDWLLPDITTNLRDIKHKNEMNRPSNNNYTGSVTVEAMLDLFVITSYFQPKRIAEVGTFIGNSTCALAMGCTADIVTCDSENSIDIEPPFDTQVTQFKQKTSAEMFESAGGSYDLIYLDGRLSGPDEIKKHIKQETIVVFDDYEGVEKGVVNMFVMRELLTKHWIIHAAGRVALLVPPAIFGYSRQ